MTGPDDKGGFSLVEALVALLIAVLVLSAAFELQRQLADGQARHQRTLELANLERNAFAITANLNPAQNPEGQADLAGGRRLRWSAAPRGPSALNTGSITSGRRFELQLYRMSVTIVDRDGGTMGVLAFDRVGWRKLDKAQPYVPPAAPPPPKSLIAPPAPNTPVL